METLFQQAEITVAMVLAFFRFGAFFFVAPFPGMRAPGVARIVLAAGIAWSFSSHLAPVQPTELVMAVLFEIALGLGLGFSLQLVVHAFALGGEAAGTQMGLGTANYVTPMQTQVTVLGSLFTMTALGVYALGDGPQLLFAFLARLLEVVPPGLASISVNAQAVTVQAGRDLLELGLRAAAPVVAAVFAAQLVLGVVARAVPQLNMMIEGPTLTISSGIVGLLASIHTFVPLVEEGFSGRIDQMVGWMSF